MRKNPACKTSRVLNFLAGEEGLEPSHAGIKIRCLNQLGDSPKQGDIMHYFWLCFRSFQLLTVCTVCAETWIERIYDPNPCPLTHLTPACRRPSDLLHLPRPKPQKICGCGSSSSPSWPWWLPWAQPGL